MTYKFGAALAMPIVLIVVCAALPLSSHGVPAFTRRTKLPCGTCHFGGSSRLTAYGRDFLYRGFRTASDEIPKDFTISNLAEYISLGGETTINSATHTDPSTTLDTAFHFNTGGPLSKNIGYYADLHLDGGPPEEGFAQFTSDPAGDSYFFGRVGHLRPNILHDFGMVHSVSPTDIRAFSDEPLWADQNDAAGNMFNLTQSATGFSLGVRSKSKFIAEAGYQKGPDDTTNAKVVFASAEQLLSDSGSGVGVLVYRGNADLDGPPLYTDRFTRAAAFASFAKEDLLITGSYQWGRDDRSSGGTRSPTGFTIEVAKNLAKDITPYARYERLDNQAGQIADAKRLGVSVRIPNIGLFAIEGFQQKTGDVTSNGVAGLLSWRL